ncbi:hypothetical protein PIB30_043919 [Stylosanthes scabra]|uniref:Uncharacterized protein n=1 Tax=Stylosanthes scabra TaxID=79078 RepID=A0ABU6VEP1_9FABA|nr:hypothetical protein [Stylosanthes scabra]
MAPKSRKRSAQDAPSASYVPNVPDETAEPYDAIRFRSLAHQKHFFEWVQNRTPNVEVPFQFHSTEFPHITAEIERRGWHYLCNPIQGKLGITLLREFYANAKKSKRERALNPPLLLGFGVVLGLVATLGSRPYLVLARSWALFHVLTKLQLEGGVVLGFLPHLGVVSSESPRLGVAKTRIGRALGPGSRLGHAGACLRFCLYNSATPATPPPSATWPPRPCLHCW